MQKHETCYIHLSIDLREASQTNGVSPCGRCLMYLGEEHAYMSEVFLKGAQKNWKKHRPIKIWRLRKENKEKDQTNTDNC